jgi:hypothetical protein
VDVSQAEASQVRRPCGIEGVEGGAAIKTEDTNANKFLDIIRNMEMTKRAG